jgi:hypothetical protein
MLNKEKSRFAGKKLSSSEMKKCKGGLSVDAVAYGCPTNPIYCCYIVNSPFGQMAVMAACTTAPNGKCMCGPVDACPI